MAIPKEVITERIFKKNFANSKIYNVPGDWPHEAYLVSKMDIRKKHRTIALTDVKAFQKSGNHTSHYFLLYLKEYLQRYSLDIKSCDTLYVDVEIFLSYSPCHPCALDMGNYITRLRNRNIYVNLTIHIGTFYKIHHVTNSNPNVVGLMQLLSIPGVELKTFNGRNDWEQFLEIAELPADWIYHTQTNERVSREEKDSFMLNGLKMIANARRLHDQHISTEDLDDHLQALSLSKETSDQYLRCNDCKITLCEYHMQKLHLQGDFTGLGAGVLALYFKGKIALEILLGK